MKQVLTNEPGKKQIFHLDNNGIATIETKTDVSSILKANKYQRDNQTSRHTEEVFNHKARVDNNAAKQWCKTRGISSQEFFSNPAILTKFLNDPDNAVWLTRKGRV